jgi:NifU-like protein involved in Fe-S cluster formation
VEQAGKRMDEAIIKYYRRLLKEDFPNAGALDAPSVFAEAIGQKMIDCGNTGNYMQLYLQVADRRITAITYLCACEPVTNVAVEVLCTLLKGKTLEEVAALTEEPFYHCLGARDEALRKKVRGLLALLNEGIAHYHNTLTGAQEPVTQDTDKPDGKRLWDRSMTNWSPGSSGLTLAGSLTHERFQGPALLCILRFGQR